MTRINDVIKIKGGVAVVGRAAVKDVAALRERFGYSYEALARIFHLSREEVKAALRYASRNGMPPTMFEP